MAVDSQVLKKSGVKAGIWNFSTTIINQLRNFIVSLILARLLMPADFGLLGMATVFAGIVDAFVDFGFGTALIQRKRVTDKQISTVFYINLGMGLVFATTMFCCSGFIANYFNEPRLVPIVKVFSFSFIIKALDVIPRSLFKRELNYRIPFKISIFSGIFSGVAGIVFAFIDWGVWALVWSQVLGWIIATGLTWLNIHWKPMLYFNLNKVKSLWRFGYKLSISVFIDQVFSRLNTIIIGKFFSASILGLFYRAQSLNGIVIQYSFSAFSGVLFPTLSKCQDDLPLLRYNVLRILHTISFLTFLFAGIMIIDAYELITIAYGYKWVDAVKFFEILGFFSITLTIPSVLVNTLMCVGRTDVNLKIEIVKKIVYIIAIPIGLHYGIYGYVLSINIAALITMPINMWALKYISLPMWPQIKAIFTNSIIFFALLIIYNHIFDNYLTSYNLWVRLFLKTTYYVIPYYLFNRIIKSEGLTATINLIKLILKR